MFETDRLNPANRKDYWPFVILAVLMAVYHIFIGAHMRDDIFYRDVLQERTLWEYLVQMWLLWTSRVVLEALAVLMCQVPLVLWKVFDVAVYAIMAMVISKLFVKKGDVYGNSIIVCMMLSYAFIDMSTAGWVVTTTTYLWPLAFGFVCMIPLKKIIEDQQVRWYEYILYGLALIYATSLEQVSIALTGIHLLFCIYMLAEKKPHWFAWMQTVLSVLSIVVILACPGNARRTRLEIAEGFVDFDMLSFIDKLELGFSSSIYHLIIKGNFVFFLFALVLAAGMLVKTRKLLYRIIGCIPALSCIILGYGREVLSRLFPAMPNMDRQMTLTGTVTLENYHKLITYLPLFLLGMICCCALIAIYILLGNSWQTFGTIGVIVVGFATRIAIALSPTVWRSGSRTYMVMLFCIGGAAVMIYSKCLYKIPFKYKSSLLVLLGIIAAGAFGKNLWELFALVP